MKKSFPRKLMVLLRFWTHKGSLGVKIHSEIYSTASWFLEMKSWRTKTWKKEERKFFIEEEERKTCNEEQKLVDKFTEENRVSDIKFMYTEGISPEKIAKGTKLSLEKIKKILETNSIYGGPGICPHSLLTYLADPDSQLHLQYG